MSNMASRRDVLSALALTGPAVLSGCFAPGGPEVRTLILRNYEPPKKIGGSVKITMDIVASSNGPVEWGAFHEVELLGYLESGKVVCRKPLGTMGPEETKTAALVCSKKPDYLTLTSAEDLCNGRTTISIIKVNAFDSEYQYSGARDKRCGDSETPIPE